MFVQERMKNCGFKLGSIEYKERLEDVNYEWRAMSADQKSMFNLKGEAATASREKVSDTPLSCTNSEVTGLTPGLQNVVV